MSDRTQTVERWLAAYNHHDGAGFASYFAEDGVLGHPATGVPEDAVGRAHIQAQMEEVWRAFPDWKLETRSLHDCGEAAWLAWTITATNEAEFQGVGPTHRRFTMQGCSHITFAADGLIARDDVYHDSAPIWQALGLLPEPEAQVAES